MTSEPQEQGPAFIRSDLQAILESAPDAFLVVDGRGTIVLANRQAEVLFGHPREKLLGAPVELLVPEAVRPRHESLRRSYCDAPSTRPMGEDRELTARRRDGTEVPVEIGLSPIRRDGALLVACSIRDVSRRRSLQAALERADGRLDARTAGDLRRLAAVTRDSDDAIAVVTLDGRLTAWNQGAERMYGYGEPEALRLSLFDLAPEDEHAAVRRTLEEAAAGEGLDSSEGRRRTKDGRCLDVLVTTTVLPDDEGRPAALALTERDVTELKRTQRALSVKDRAVESAASPIALCDAAGTIDYVNPAFVEAWGYSAASEVLGHDVTELAADPGEPRRVLAEVRKAGRWTGEVRPRRRDGTTFPASLAASGVSDDEGRLLYVLGAFQDLTELRRSEKDARERARQQAAVAELGMSALRAGADLDAVYERATAVVAETLGVELCRVLELDEAGEQLVVRAGVGWREGTVGHATVPPGMGSQAGYALASDGPVIAEDLATETRFQATTLLTGHGAASGLSVTIPGSPRPFGVLEAYSRQRRRFTANDSNFLQAVANVVGQAVERAGAEEQIREQESLARLGAMAATIAHDIKSPLAGIYGAIQVYSGKLDADTTDARMFGLILERITELTGTIEDMLAYARPRKPNKEPVQILPLLEETVELLRNDPGFGRLAVSVGGDDVTVPCDRLQIGPVLWNLLANAAQAMEGEGDIGVQVTVRNGRADVVVRDAGPGIPDALRDKVFEPFFTTKRGGTGLGLATVKRVVEAHGGDVGIDCPDEGGTRVVIGLPLA